MSVEFIRDIYVGGCICVNYFNSHKRRSFLFKCSLQQRGDLLCFLLPWFIVLHTLVNSREMDPIVRDDNWGRGALPHFQESSIL